MRRLFITSTLFFWVALGGFWLADILLAEPPTGSQAAGAEKVYSLEEVARHEREDDCWMVIGNQVYDLTTYLPQHPSDPALILPWCGKEASEAYRTKTRGRPHSSRADQLLSKYRVGTLGRG